MNAAHYVHSLGYTQYAQIDGVGPSFNALVRPGDDFEGTFGCYDLDANEWLRIEGWQANVCVEEMGVTYTQDEERVRNAAQKLLEVLESVLYFEDGFIRDGVLGDALAEWLDEARAAIAKATGAA